MAFEALDELYDDVILDHRRNPRGKDEVADPDLTADGVNPFCGDEVHLRIRLVGDRVSAAGFKGEGCSINQAAGSMTAEALDGRTLEEVERLAATFEEMMAGGDPPGDDLEALGDLKALAGVRQFPIRIKCALLSWSALTEAIRDYRRDVRL